MNAKKQKLLIENILTTTEIIARCCHIVKPDYFEPEYKPVIKFILNYYEKYRTLPDTKIVNAEFDLDFVPQELPPDKINFTLDSIEKFCQDEGMVDAIRESLDLIQKGEKSGIREKISKALEIALYRKLGRNLYDSPEEYLKSLLDSVVYYSTGIISIDKYLDGGLARGQFTIFSGNSGAGKSLIMANIGANYSKQGLDVLYLSIELPIDMIYLRLAAITSETPIGLWKQKIPEISGKIDFIQQSGAGKYVIERIKNGMTANDIRAYLRQYESEFKKLPDVLIVDYLDLMSPNGGKKTNDIFQQDKEIAEELSELIYEMNLIGISASQQNRSGLTATNQTQAVIAGGISKVYTVHNYIGLYADDVMKIKGEIIASFLKTRTSAGAGHSVMLQQNINTLVISDPKNERNEKTTVIVEKTKGSDGKISEGRNKVLEHIENKKTKTPVIIGDVKGMPTERVKDDIITEKQGFINDVTGEEEHQRDSFTEPTINKPKEDLLDMITAFNTN